MIQTASGEVVITNDGATILKHMSVMHPAARMVRVSRHLALSRIQLINHISHHFTVSLSISLQLRISKLEMVPLLLLCSPDLF